MSGRGSVRGVVTAFLTLGCCLLAAPTAHADFDDLLDTVLGAATAGADVDPGGLLPADTGDLGDLGVLQDPLAQLDQLFHDTPGAADATSAHGTPDSPTDATPVEGTPDGAEHGSGAPSGDTPGGAEHGSESSSSNNTPSLPKFSLPSTGNGSGGSGGGPSGSSGSSAGNGAKKANSSASKPVHGLG